MGKTIDEKARELKNAYYRKYRKENKEKIREHQENYWKRKAEAELKKQQTEKE